MDVFLTTYTLSDNNVSHMMECVKKPSLKEQLHDEVKS